MKKILVSIIFGLVVGSTSLLFFNVMQAKLLGIVVFLVVMWTNNALPLGVVSMLPILLFPAFGIVSLDKVTPNYAKSVIFLFLGGFMLAIAMQKTNLHKQLSDRLIKIFPNTVRGTIYAMAIISALLSSILSNTTITLMLMPIALFISMNEKLKVRILLAIAYGASIGGIITPIGTPPNLLLIGYLDTIGIEAPSFTTWIGMMAPVAIGMILFVPWVLGIGIKDEVISDNKSKLIPFTYEQKKLLWILGVLSLLLLLNTPIKPWYSGLGLNEKGLLLTAGVILFLPGVKLLCWEDSRNIPYEIIFLFGAGFSIAYAFGATNLAEAIAQKLSFVHSLPLWFTLIVIALVISFSTEITSNTALTSISLPVMVQLYGPDNPVTLLILLVTTVAASYAFMLPIATPPNAIIMSSRMIQIKTMAKFGFFINLIGAALVSLTAYFLWHKVL